MEYRELIVVFFVEPLSMNELGEETIGSKRWQFMEETIQRKTEEMEKKVCGYSTSILENTKVLII